MSNLNAWTHLSLGDVTVEGKERNNSQSSLLKVFGVDRHEGLTADAKYKSKDLSRYKVIQPGMFAYNPMRLNIGSIAPCTEREGAGLVSPDYVVFSCKKDVLLPQYMKYFICGREWKNWTEYAGVGSVRVRIYYKELARMPLSLPPVAEQKAIAHILGKLDDKIELNRKMNATLESMAQAMFKSWFVDFDPVIDNALAAGNPIPEPLQQKAQTRKELGDQKKSLPPDIQKLFPDQFQFNEELGWIPEGWEVRAVADAVSINPKLSLKKGQIAPYADMKSLPTSGFAIDDVITKQFSGGTKFQNGDVLMARITPCLENGKAGIVDFLNQNDVGFGSTEFTVLSPQEGIKTPFLACLSRHEKFRQHCIANMVGSSGRQRVHPSCFDSFYLAIPHDGILHEFNRFGFAIFERSTFAKLESGALAKLRDTLLPKLLSGELRIPDAEKLVAEQA